MFKFNSNRRLMRNFITASLLPLIFTISTGTTLAQGSSDKLEEVVVTGSILKRTEASTAMPISILTADELDLRGLNTVADAVVELPSNNAGTMNASWSSFGFATGASAVSLRGLTTSSSLTVFDGMRMAPYPLGDDGRRNFVDLGTIPDAIIDRIEVLKDGASSTYGADAIAGVVNVITKKQITGLHFNGSYGVSEEGDGDEYRADVTWGTGDLESDGFNFYANFEIQQSDPIAAKERPKFGSWDWTNICKSGGACLDNSNPNGIQADGSIFGISYSMQPMVRPYDPVAGASLGNWQLINPAKGCFATPYLKEVNPTNAAAVGLTGPTCENDYFGTLINIYPRIKRWGLNLRYTQEINDSIEFHAMFDYYRVKTTESGGTPWVFGGTTTPGGPDVVRVGITPVLLPVYVCPLGATGYVTCDATNGVYNRNNPFATAGQVAQVDYRLPFARDAATDTENFRYAAGINGSFDFGGSEWDYTLDGVFSQVKLDLTRTGYPIPRRILDVVYDGSFNFVNPKMNSQTMWDYIAPPVTTHNTSEVTQFQGTLSRPLFDMSGGPVVGAVGAAWRREEVNAPSANPAKADPYERYLSVNTVAATGSRNVKSVFFEVEAPVLNTVTVNVSGRYDDYSTGQSNFSPKVNVQYQALDGLKFRGTYSQGFRIPSFNEAFGAPTTGYVSSAIDGSTAAGAAFLAAHGNNAYASGTYSYGLTATGNPSLDPEESDAYTVGAVLQPGMFFEPLEGLSLTVDYWHITVDKLISGADYSAVLDTYYANNGVVNIEGINVIPADVDPDYPSALPLIGFIQYSYQNVDSEVASGIDLTATYTHEFNTQTTGDFTFRSHLDMSHLLELSKTIAGTQYNYEGTLSPCDVTSCSGAPDWRMTWVNSVDWRKFTFALTMNYTGGYSDSSVDYGGDPSDCSGASLYASVYAYDDGSPYKCSHDAWIDWDFSANYQFNDKIRIYANVVNVFDQAPEFDPAPAYFLYGFNPAWELDGWRGRYFRVGLKYDF